MGDMRDPDEFFDLAEKIIRNINIVFDRDNSLDEFDIVPVESQSNRSPVIHVNHKLALESWCVPILYSHSIKFFCELLPSGSNASSSKRNRSGARNGNGCRGYRHSRQNGNAQLITEGEKMERRLTLSRILVLLNPDLTVAWNSRREAFNQSAAYLHQEFLLVTLVASRKPKSPEAFTYRKWLVKNLLKDNLTTDNLEELIGRELQAVERAAAAYFSNYHAWDYRRFLLETFLQGTFCPHELKLKVMNWEKTTSDRWIDMHISDHSGFHYRQRLLMQISKMESNIITVYHIIQKELENNMSLIMRYPGHETLWYHRRFLLQFIVPKLQKNNSNKNSRHLTGDETDNCNFTTNNHSHPMETNCDDYESDHQYGNTCWTGSECSSDLADKFQCLRNKEKDLVTSLLTVNHKLLHGRDDLSNVNFITKDSSNLTLMYTQRHMKWLTMVFHWVVDNN